MQKEPLQSVFKSFRAVLSIVNKNKVEKYQRDMTLDTNK